MWSETLLPDSHEYTRLNPREGDLEEAVEAFGHGTPVLVHDDDERENEVDLVVPAYAVTPAVVAQLRNDAGGLVCVALADEVAAAFDLPFMHDAVDHPAGQSTDIAYDERSSFSLTVNHRETFTGITDNDRARTIVELSEAAAAPVETDFAGEFDTPGHVHLLRAAPNLLDDRQGHTELGIALAELADVPPAVVVCEMLDDRTGGAMSRSNALTYARANDSVFLTGSTVIDEMRA
ncbi:3,4-dihydroxy-2-butanone-4-phosphate synthase [Halomarina ordinaria]|uniref:3,4-dihydroxy-2-butanone 4-phosphate synthase n=1 Tax=Halomarina ordinaria TaxID=3033939 RepID=A0ABD5UGY0_9EURY|nr:3,4-dihydroxy-2-butanone-4-phosphate synthase [Halomarina sp. PSRA2]